MRRKRTKYWCGIGIVMSIFLGVFAGPISSAHKANANPGILRPNSKAFGMTYEEWSARWWQWTFSIPVDQNPLFDANGECPNGANGQFGPVWFLAGAFQDEGPVVRDCTVPPGKALFFPIVDGACSELEGDGTTEQELRDCARALIDGVVNNSLQAMIDGVAVRNLQDYRISSRLFTLGPFPNNNLFQFFEIDAPPGTTTSAVADGYYLLLPPLSKGMHTIHFTAAIDSTFTLDITYHLNVTRHE